MREVAWHQQLERGKNTTWWLGIKVLVWIFTFFLLFFAGRIFLRQQDEFRRVRERAKLIDIRYEETLASRAAIEDQYRDVTSEQQLEELSREELGFVRSGDIIYEDAK